MNRIEKPEWSQHSGQEPQRKLPVRSEAMPHANTDIQSLSTPLRPRPAIFVAFDAEALALAQKQLAGYMDITFWDVQKGWAGMPGYRLRYLFELKYGLAFLYPCSPALCEALIKYPRMVAVPPMSAAWAAKGPLALAVWVFWKWPKSSRILQSREAIYVYN